MQISTTTIKGFSNYVIQITMGGLEWSVIDTRTNEKVLLEWDRHTSRSMCKLEDDEGLVHEVNGGDIHQLILPYMRDMCGYNRPYEYPEIDLDGDIWCRHNGRWITESERIKLVLNK